MCEEACEILKRFQRVVSRLWPQVRSAARWHYPSIWGSGPRAFKDSTTCIRLTTFNEHRLAPILLLGLEGEATDDQCHYHKGCSKDHNWLVPVHALLIVHKLKSLKGRAFRSPGHKPRNTVGPSRACNGRLEQNATRRQSEQHE